MRKSLVVSLIGLFTLTLMAPALAASPSFSDVPAGHWAYSAVTELADAGLIDGYGDGTFKGDKAMSRYEFAIFITKAMDSYGRADEANKQIIDKLSAEFATEMNRLGTRVSKVEAKTNTWVSGDTRLRFVGDSPKAPGSNKLHGSDNFDFRQRIMFNGTINKDTSWTARLATTGSNKFGNADYGTGSEISLDIANVTVKNALGLDSIRAGRSALDFFGNGLIGKASLVDGVLLNKKFGDVQFKGWTGNIKSVPVADMNTGIGDCGDANTLTTGQLSYDVNNNLRIGFGYYWADVPGSSDVNGKGILNTNTGKFDSSKGYDVAVAYKFGKLSLVGDYVSTNLDNAVNLPANPKAWAIQLSNTKGPLVLYPAANLVNPAQPGSNAWMVSYRSGDAGSVPTTISTYDTTAIGYYKNVPYSAYLHGIDNVNALYIAYQNVIAKNVLLSLEYQDIKIKDRALTDLNSDNLNKTYLAKLEFFY